MTSDVLTTSTRVSLILGSSNKKTGPIPVSYTSAVTCPSACAFHEAGCYALTSTVGFHWRKVTSGRSGNDWIDFVKQVASMPAGTLWRHNVAGDLPGAGNEIDANELSQLVRANGRKHGFTFSHKPVIGDDETATRNRAAIKSANENGFTINLSANTLEEADKLADLAIGPVVVVQDAPDGIRTDMVTPQGRLVRTCPAVYRDTSCWSCGLCARQDRKIIVGFPIHGTQQKAARTIIRRVTTS